MRILAVLTAMAALAVAAPAHADWQWTKWGMTPEEVMAASQGKTVVNGSGGLTLTEPLVVQDCTFKVSFEFNDKKKLEAVALYSDQDCYQEMNFSLQATYGPPAPWDGPGAIYLDPVKGNRISIRLAEGTTHIKYRPLPSGL